MVRLWGLVVTVAVAGSVGAAPPPVPVAKTPITKDNAAKVEKGKEFPIDAFRLILGPGPKELTVLRFQESIDVVDDVTFQTVRQFGAGKKPIDVAFSPGGKLWAWNAAQSADYTVEDPAAGKAFALAVGDSPGHASFSPDGKRIAVGKTYWDPNAEGVGHSEVNIYDADGKLLRTLEKSGPGAITPRFSPDGKLLAVGNRNYETRIFDADTGKLLHTFTNKRMTQGIAFRPDGKRLAVGYVDGHIGILDVVTGKVIHQIASGCREVYSVDWGIKGDVLATSGNKGPITLWDAETMSPLKELARTEWTIQVRFSADGSRLFTAGQAEPGPKADRKVAVWGIGDREK